eukprot:2176473-Prymnesium_polylepis.1
MTNVLLLRVLAPRLRAGRHVDVQTALWVGLWPMVRRKAVVERYAVRGGLSASGTLCGAGSRPL